MRGFPLFELNGIKITIEHLYGKGYRFSGKLFNCVWVLESDGLAEGIAEYFDGSIGFFAGSQREVGVAPGRGGNVGIQVFTGVNKGFGHCLDGFSTGVERYEAIFSDGVFHQFGASGRGTEAFPDDEHIFLFRTGDGRGNINQ